MTGIVVSRRDGIARAPDGTQWRVHRGKTLADTRHPAVVAYPNDWTPVTIELSVPGTSSASVPQGSPVAAEIDELRNELAEIEELADQRGTELQRLQDGLAERGALLPDEDSRSPGWLVDFVLDVIDAIPSPPSAAPKPPRRKPPAVPR